MGWLTVALPVIAAWRFGRVAHPLLFWLSIGIAALTFWSFGIMHNYAIESAAARRRLILANMKLEGRSDNEIREFDDQPVTLSRSDRAAAANWATSVNMLASFSGIVLLVVSFVA